MAVAEGEAKMSVTLNVKRLVYKPLPRGSAGRSTYWHRLGRLDRHVRICSCVKRTRGRHDHVSIVMAWTGPMSVGFTYGVGPWR